MAFLVIAIWIGSRLSPRMFFLASKLKVHGMLLATSLCFCLLLAYLAGRIELAPIVGAFAAGLILDPLHYRDFRERGEHTVDELLRPISSFLVPIFFVLMGVRVDLRTFADSSILGFALILTLVAILGKQACALAVIEKGLDRLSVGIGMIPRGEVGLDLRQHWRLPHVAGKPGNQQFHLLCGGHHGDPDHTSDPAPSQDLFSSWRSQEEVARPIENNGGSVKQWCRCPFAARRRVVRKENDRERDQE